MPAKHLAAVEVLRRRGLLPGHPGSAPRITDVSRRNGGLRVRAGRDQSYFLKVGRPGKGPGSVAHEAMIYRHFRATPRQAFARHVPAFHHYDAQTCTLILELWPRARTLREHHVRAQGCPPVVAERLAEMVAAIHSLPPLGAPASRPWVLSIDRPDPSILRYTSPGALELIRVVQRTPSLRGAVENVRTGWRSTAFTHQDLRWDNCLVRSRSPRGADVEIKLVDWEFAGAGDPAWDVGFVLADYLVFWILSIPLDARKPATRTLDAAGRPLESILPAIQAFWATYTARMGLSAREAGEELHRALRAAAVRLLQNGFERLELEDFITGHVRIMMTLASNIADRPRDAAARLLRLE